MERGKEQGKEKEQGKGKEKEQRQGKDRRRRMAVLAAVCVGLAVWAPGLCACGRLPEARNTDRGPGAQSGQGAQGEPVTLTLAMFGYDAEVVGQVEEFNRTHGDCRIVLEQYLRSELPEEDGVARLQREIMTGKGPDLIDFGADYATSDIVGGYTEDLWPYLEAERREKGQEYFDNILDAFLYNGKLYAMPVSFTLQTFAGDRAVVGAREGWSIREMMECYDAREEGTILYPGETKKDVFGTILHGSMDCYVDWERGEAHFDSDGFARVLAFADRFPDTLRIAEDYSVKETFYEGRALLLPLRLKGLYGICEAEYIFGTEDICCVGFPVEEGRGTMIAPSATMLAISGNSSHKDEAWEFVAGFLRPEYQSGISQGFPVCRGVLEERLAQNLEPEYGEDEEGNPVPIARHRILFEGEEPVEVFCITETQAEKLLGLIETATLYSAGDRELYRILLEEADSFFRGDKGLEETCRIMQARASLFVSERVKQR